MQSSVFIELRFWLLLVLSILVPIAMYYGLPLRRTISRRAISSSTVLALGLLLALISGVDVSLLQTLGHLATRTLSVVGDAVFLSELGVALHVLSAVWRHWCEPGLARAGAPFARGRAPFR